MEQQITPPATAIDAPKVLHEYFASVSIQLQNLQGLPAQIQELQELPAQIQKLDKKLEKLEARFSSIRAPTKVQP